MHDKAKKKFQVLFLVYFIFILVILGRGGKLGIFLLGRGGFLVGISGLNLDCRF